MLTPEMIADLQINGFIKIVDEKPPLNTPVLVAFDEEFLTMMR